MFILCAHHSSPSSAILAPIVLSALSQKDRMTQKSCSHWVAVVLDSAAASRALSPLPGKRGYCPDGL